MPPTSTMRFKNRKKTGVRASFKRTITLSDGDHNCNSCELNFQMSEMPESNEILFRNSHRMHRFNLRHTQFVVLAVMASLLFACNPYPDYDKLESGIYKKLNAFADCDPDLDKAEFFIMDVDFRPVNSKDTAYHFELHHGKLADQHAPFGISTLPVGLKLQQVLDSMQCGDDISLILPFEELDRSYIVAYADTPQYKIDDQIELRLHLKKTFSRKEYLSYLMHAAQQQELEETDAIELYLMNQTEFDYNRFGKCFKEEIQITQGDSVKVGKYITIAYTTHLLDGTALDSLTTLQFDFGRPGQLIGGFQYGLSLMREGEHARIYLPSALAFGENGSSTGIVPRNTPVYFDVVVKSVE